MVELITIMFQSFTTVISSFASGIKDAFMALLYVDPTATNPVISELAKFGFLMLGVSMAIGLVYTAFSLIRNRG